MQRIPQKQDGTLCEEQRDTLDTSIESPRNFLGGIDWNYCESRFPNGIKTLSLDRISLVIPEFKFEWKHVARSFVLPSVVIAVISSIAVGAHK